MGEAEEERKLMEGERKLMEEERKLMEEESTSDWGGETYPTLPTSLPASLTVGIILTE